MSDDAVHQAINAHLLAAERNPLKRAQHLLAATQHAEANGIPHLGRWTQQQITRRAGQHELHERFLALKDGPARAQAVKDERDAARIAERARQTVAAASGSVEKALATKGTPPVGA